jgi:hypothetical protein
MNYGRWPLPLRSYFAVLLLVLTAQFVSAQYTTGTIQGSVLDASGAAVKSAHIALRNTETNQTKQFTTGDDGVYLFAAVPPGAYELTAEASGFSKEILKFAASSNDRLTENLVLKVASGNTTVVVQAGNATEFHTTDAQLDTTRVAEEVDGLPLQSRTVTSLVTLEPGVQPMYTAGRGSLVKVAGAQTGLFTANGGRPESSNIEIDLIDANDWEFGGIAVGAEPAPDFVAEFKVITSNAAAEYGVKSGGEALFVTKSGTNNWHGDAYNFLQNDALNARDYFDATGKATRIDRNNYGFASGGALRRDKTFLFGGWEQLKVIGGGFTTLAYVPSAAAIATVTDTTIKNLINKYLPTATGSTTNSEVGTVSQQFSAPTNSYQFLLRGDQNFSNRHSLTLRYFQATGTQVLTFPAFNTLAGFDSNLHNESRNANITDSFTLSPVTNNQLRLGYDRSVAMLPPQNGLVSPRFTVSGLVGFGALPYFPQGRVFDVYQLNDIVSHIAGKHILKLGIDGRRISDGSVNATNENGSYTFASLDAFLQGSLSGWSQAFGPSARLFGTKLFSAFAQDDYKFRPDLTVNLGLRWEYQGALTVGGKNISLLDPSLNETIGSAGKGALGAFRVGSPVVNANPANIAPRVGFAWNPRSGNLSVRGGYGFYWDSFTFTALADARSNPPSAYSFALSGASSFTGSNSLDTLLAGTAPIEQTAKSQLGSYGSLTNFGSVTTANRNQRNPYTQRYNLSLEYKLSNSTVADLGYVGAKATHLPLLVPINSVTNGPAAATSQADELSRLAEFEAAYAAENGAGNNRLDSRFNQVNFFTDAAASSYNALQFEVRHSLRYGLNLQASYTWSKSIDNSSSNNPTQDSNDNGFAQNASDLHAERAVSNYDVPHRVVVTSVWNLPVLTSRHDLLDELLLKHWSWQTVNSWQTGVPGTILSGSVEGISDVNLDGNYIPNGDDNTRANFNVGGKGFKLNNSASIQEQTQYTQPLLGNNGTAGRNTVRLPDLLDIDWSLQKEWRLSEGGVHGSGPWGLQFRTEAYNLFNNPYLRPSTDNWRTVSSTGFGLLNSAGPSRSLQLALKLVW